METSDWRYQLNFWRQEFWRRGVQGFAHKLSPRVNELLVRALEIEGQPHELNLNLPDPFVSSVLIQNNLCSPPCSLQIPPQSNVLAADGHWWPSVSVFNLRDVKLDVASSLAFVGGRVISQSGLGHRGSRDAAFITGALRRVEGLNPILIKEPIAPLGQTTNYYHFLIESLPRILRIKEVNPSVTFVTDRRLPDLAQDILNFAGIDNEILIMSGVVETNNLWICEPSPLFLPHPDDLQLLSIKLGVRVNSRVEKEKPFSENIYISRSKSSRSLLNESDLEQYLSNRGFDILHLETMSVDEQIRRVQKAKVVIAPHGAGLSNLVFMGKGSKVIEISSGEWWWPCFRRMAYSLDLNYELLLLPSSQATPHGNASDAIQQIDEILRERYEGDSSQEL